MYNFESLSSDCVYVIGDIMIDHYIYGNCERISPEAPVQIVDVQKEEYTLGGAGNVVKNLVAFEVNTGIISVCGPDSGAEIITNALRELKIADQKILVDGTRSTTIKTRIVSSKHQLLRLDKENRHYIDNDIAGQVLDTLKSQINKIKILIISDYCKGVLSGSVINSIINICRENNVITIVDSK